MRGLLNIPKSVLITGAAGFIGSHLAGKLLQMGMIVIGLDNINAYYDVNLKLARLKKLETFNNFIFIKGDMANKACVDDIFKQYHPDIVVNLGAQAGVRYSVTNPQAYMNSNMTGFFNILEACRHSYDEEGGDPVEHLICASSSSVYGHNKKIPYSTNDKVDKSIRHMQI